MSNDKKPAKSNKNATKPDVGHPGKSAPSATSKPVLVTNRPVLKDPMVVDEGVKSEDAQGNLSHAGAPKLQPLEQTPQNDTGQVEPPTATKQPAATKAPAEEKPPAKETPGAAPESPEAALEPDQDQDKIQKNNDQEAAKQARHDAEIQRLIDSRKYELPINAVEKRKAKHFVVLGFLLAVLLAMAWADIALDAGLVHVDGVKPVTHFFSN